MCDIFWFVKQIVFQFHEKLSTLTHVQDYSRFFIQIYRVAAIIVSNITGAYVFFFSSHSNND